MFEKSLRMAGVDEATTQAILSVPYTRDDNPKQDAANFYAAAMRQCETLLDEDTLEEVMFQRSCCKTGFRLDNARKFAKDHAGKPLEEQLALLGTLRYMGKPELTPEGDILTRHCAGTMRDGKLTCSCWQLSGKTPVGGTMPLSYCLCCAGHFRFHYQKALGLELRTKEVVFSVFYDDTQGCAFRFQVMGPMKRRGR